MRPGQGSVRELGLELAGLLGTLIARHLRATEPLVGWLGPGLSYLKASRAGPQGSPMSSLRFVLSMRNQGQFPLVVVASHGR